MLKKSVKAPPIYKEEGAPAVGTVPMDDESTYEPAADDVAYMRKEEARERAKTAPPKSSGADPGESASQKKWNATRPRIAQNLFEMSQKMPRTEWGTLFNEVTGGWTPEMKGELTKEMKQMGLSWRESASAQRAAPKAAPAAGAGGGGGADRFRTPWAFKTPTGLVPVGIDVATGKPINLDTGDALPLGIQIPGMGGAGKEGTGQAQQKYSGGAWVSNQKFAVAQDMLQRNMPLWEAKFGATIDAGGTLSKEGIASMKKLLVHQGLATRGMRDRNIKGSLADRGLMTAEQEQLLEMGDRSVAQSEFNRAGGWGMGMGGGGTPAEMQAAYKDHIQSLGTLNKRFDEWEKAVKPAIESGKDLTKGQQTAAAMLKRDFKGLDAMQLAAIEQGDARTTGRIEKLRGRAPPLMGQADQRADDQAWKQAMDGGGRMGAVTRGFQAAKALMIGWTPMQMNRAWNMMGGGIFAKDIPAAAASGAAVWQGIQGLSGPSAELPTGVTGGVMRFEAAQRRASISAGEMGYRTWGAGMPVMDWAKQGQAVFGPALGAGMVAGIGLNAMGGAFTAAAGPVGAGIAIGGSALAATSALT
ncbi:MAG: hypothetical protein KAJ19_08910, partial [Gammaproteobacteria bacterium]|nr:hypothetical protein [Gammaproteobacteria bacterium]